MKKSKVQNAIDFYLLATKLKYKIRSGWDEKHWKVTSKRVESIAEHIYGTCILAIAVESEFEYDIDLNKVIKMLAVHELGEVIIGDITPFDGISPEEKLKIEHEAISSLVDGLVKKQEIIDLLWEFDERKTKEAIFAHHCDKLEADLQAKFYQDMGYQRPLTDQAGNVAFESSKVQKILENGAQNAFDVWYECDKALFDDDEVFSQMLEYAKTHTLK